MPFKKGNEFGFKKGCIPWNKGKTKLDDLVVEKTKAFAFSIRVLSTAQVRALLIEKPTMALALQFEIIQHGGRY